MDQELFDLLVEFSDSEYDTSCDNQVAQKPKKRKFRRKSTEVPRVFKNDVRWSYSNMVVNVLSSQDVFAVYYFFKAFSQCVFSCVHQIPEMNHVDVGVTAFIRFWYRYACCSPDLVYGFEHGSVRNYTDGSSEVSMEMFVRGNYFFDPPALKSRFEGSEDAASDASAVGNKRGLPVVAGPSFRGPRKYVSHFSDRSRCDGRIRALVDTEDESLLEELDGLRPALSAAPYNLYQRGSFVMRLDTQKRIVSTTYRTMEHAMTPISIPESI